jgi:hypothetical protein
MNAETEKKNLVDLIIIVITAVYAFIVFTILYFEILSNNSFGGKSFLLIILIPWPILGLIDQLNGHIKKGDIRKRTVILSLAMRGILITLLAASMYRILYSKDYNLKYTYWIALVAFATIVITLPIGALIKDYKKRKSEGKKRNILFIIVSVLFISLWPCFIAYNIAVKYAYPERQIVLDNLKVPESITIYRYDRESNLFNPNFYSKINITEEDNINKIIKNLQSTKIESFTGTSLINYSRMRCDNLPYYMLMFHYTGSDSWDNVLEDGYIDYVVVTTNRNTTIEETKKRSRLIFGVDIYNEIFPISLSQETVDMIFEYIKLH